ncbi:hypothetical protein Egran_06635 [Elaphomyces granulatus]|uniref:Uncharacterized protein n=1 Tax=Elaphomyces granulatus TaxID=519963 RepID=A0A232LN80_9EURO|nr:hypothetical protein Egran_06635 [Elaphomyces granulatus]
MPRRTQQRSQRLGVSQEPTMTPRAKRLETRLRRPCETPQVDRDGSQFNDPDEAALVDQCSTDHDRIQPPVRSRKRRAQPLEAPASKRANVPRSEVKREIVDRDPISVNAYPHGLNPSPPLSSSARSVEGQSHPLEGFTDVEGYSRLELATRQWYISSFSNKEVDPPIQAALPALSGNPAEYRRAVARVRDFYKRFKSRTLSDARNWFAKWVALKQNHPYATVTDFKVLKKALNKSFRTKWLPEVFGWASKAIDFNDCTPLGHAFAKYAFVQLVIRARLHFLYREKDNKDPSLAKHSREYLLAAIDGLRTRAEFQELTINDFPLRKSSLPRRRGVRYELDLEEDSDGSVGDNFDSH